MSSLTPTSHANGGGPAPKPAVATPFTLGDAASSSPDHLMIVTREGVVTQVGALPEGWPANTIGRSLAEILPPESRAPAMDAIHRACAHDRTEAFDVRPGAGAPWYAVRVAPLHARGRPTHAVLSFRDVTQRREAEVRLAEHERFLRELFDATPMLIYVYDAVERKNLYINAAVERVLGYTRDEIQGMGTDLFANIVHPEDVARHAEHVTRLARSGEGEVLEFEYRVWRRDGELVWLTDREMVWTRDPDGSPRSIVGTCVDSTTRHQVEERLAAQDRFLNAIIGALPLVVYVFNLDARRVEFVSPVVRALLGRTEDDMMALGDRVIPEVMHPDDQPAVAAHFERLRAMPDDRSADVDYRMRHADARWIWFRSRDRVWKRDPDGRVTHILGTAADITQRLEQESALRQSDEQLRQAQKMEAVGLLASGVAHDFNNLLTAIRGYVSLARATLQESHPAVESLDGVEEAARQAAGVAGALLAFARKGTPKKSPVELGPVVEVAARLFKRVLPRTITLFTDTSAAAGLWVSADATQLQQVVMNLALNARDAIRGPGMIRIVVAPADGPGGKVARLSVIDTGEGISPEVRTRLFEPFFSTKRRDQGTGLGLAVIHGIVSEHAGKIEVHSKPGEGSTFVVDFPAILPPSHAVELKEPRPPVSALGTGDAALVIEPRALIRGLMSSMLQSLGFEVVLATDAAHGREMLLSRRRDVDLVVAGDSLGEDPLEELVEAARAQGWAGRVVLIHAGKDAPTPPGIALLRMPFQLTDLRRLLTQLPKPAPAAPRREGP